MLWHQYRIVRLRKQSLFAKVCTKLRTKFFCNWARASLAATETSKSRWQYKIRFDGYALLPNGPRVSHFNVKKIHQNKHNLLLWKRFVRMATFPQAYQFHKMNCVKSNLRWLFLSFLPPCKSGRGYGYNTPTLSTLPWYFAKRGSKNITDRNYWAK